MTAIRALREWWTWRVARRKALRRWRDTKVLLMLVLVCLLCQVFGLACGVVGYVLRRLGILPEDTASPVGDAQPAQVRSFRGVGAFSVPMVCGGIV